MVVNKNEKRVFKNYLLDILIRILKNFLINFERVTLQSICYVMKNIFLSIGDYFQNNN